MLCADTQHSGGMKLSDSKLATGQHSDKSWAIAYAGSVRYARTAIRKFEETLTSIPNPSISQIASELQSVLRWLHEDHLYRHPDWRTGTLQVQFLIAIWSKKDQARGLYVTEDTALAPVEHYECIGSGNYLGHYLMREWFFDSTTSLSDAVTLALESISKINQYDESCGGGIEMTALRNDGTLGPRPCFDIPARHKFTNDFELATRELFRRIWSSENQKTDAKSLNDFCKRLRLLDLNERRDQQKICEALVDQLFGAK
jgi:20S proteasome alpha/beta subunit